MLKIHNTLLRDKQVFAPIQPGLVRIYVCGMTVYDYCHLGHARVLVVFDMVTRWLRASGYQVVYVRNITDIDDKIIRRAQENGESIQALTDRYIAYMHEDAAALGVLKPDHEPRATQHVAAMQRLIGALERNGYAYVAANRDVCYSVRKFEGYGRLSGNPWRTCAPASASTSWKASTIRSTSCSGSMPRKASRRRRNGIRPGAAAAPAGTSSARP